jgi:hypothetical protein
LADGNVEKMEGTAAKYITERESILLTYTLEEYINSRGRCVYILYSIFYISGKLEAL